MPSDAEEQPEVRIEVGTTGITRSASGTVAGPIWLSAGGTGLAFPEVGWSDFPVALLATWIPSLRRLAARGETAECLFMDGPYHFVVSASADEGWRIACFERRVGPSVANAVAEWTASPTDFFESALAAARAVRGHCDARQWFDDDTDRLREAIAFAEPDAAR